MMNHSACFRVETEGRGLYEVTAEVAKIVKASQLSNGLCCVFLHHTSASILISENADPTVLADLEAFFARLVKDGDPLFAHDAEGDDDMPAHVRSVLTGSSLTIPIRAGKLDLGTWQGIFLYEHRKAEHQRKISVTLVG